MHAVNGNDNVSAACASNLQAIANQFADNHLREFFLAVVLNNCISWQEQNISLKYKFSLPQVILTLSLSKGRYDQNLSTNT